jgi:hypothetical protein
MEKQKRFDAVRTMREIREELNRELAGMSFEEQQQYIREHLPASSRRSRRTPT